ncbi:MAG: flagellar motor protein MotB [Vicinamibacterales bacterium]
MNVKLTASSVSRDRWLISYADFMTLLCAFFTTLYAASLTEAPAAPAPATAPVEVTTPAPVTPAVADPAAALRAQVEAALAPELEAGYLQLVEDPRGLVIEVPEAGAFDVGQADLAPRPRACSPAWPVSSARCPTREDRSHTDDTPIRTSKCASNWELSTARATRVVEFLIETGQVPADRLSAASAAKSTSAGVELEGRGPRPQPACRPRPAQRGDGARRGTASRRRTVRCPFSDAELERLLDRPVRHLVAPADRRRCAGRRLVVTGAGGSVGSELSRQLADCRPALLTLVDHSELHLFGSRANWPSARQAWPSSRCSATCARPPGCAGRSPPRRRTWCSMRPPTSTSR